MTLGGLQMEIKGRVKRDKLASFLEELRFSRTRTLTIAMLR